MQKLKTTNEKNQKKDKAFDLNNFLKTAEKRSLLQGYYEYLAKELEKNHLHYFFEILNIDEIQNNSKTHRDLLQHRTSTASDKTSYYIPLFKTPQDQKFQVLQIKHSKNEPLTSEKINYFENIVTHAQLVQLQQAQVQNQIHQSTLSRHNSEEQIVGHSEALIKTLELIDKVALSNATILIQGESGTGKELFAKRIHKYSARHDKPYITINCGTLQESLLESELFGHEKGSFTGAIAQKIGLAELAHNGTLFLDEIAEISPSIQTKLLRFLQEGEFYRIGGQESIKVNVRIISATNKNLEEEVKSGAFREDLYYRLNTITIYTPPLRKRKEDISLLIEHFLKDKPMTRISKEALCALESYSWPGNIRELQNVIERLAILSDNGDISTENLPIFISTPQKQVRPVGYEADAELPLEYIEKEHILKALDYFNGNKTRAAKSLGITIKTLYNKLHRYGIEFQTENSAKSS